MPIDPSTAFVSYSREDLEFVLRLAKDLKAKGAKVWMDKLDIRPGQRWEIEVQTALDGCQRMLVILSPASIASKNVLAEAAFAIDEGKEVIPVLIQECKIPFRLRPFQYADLSTDYAVGLKELLFALGVEQQPKRTMVVPGPLPPQRQLDEKAVRILKELAVGQRVKRSRTSVANVTGLAKPEVNEIISQLARIGLVSNTIVATKAGLERRLWFITNEGREAIASPMSDLNAAPQPAPAVGQKPEHPSTPPSESLVKLIVRGIYSNEKLQSAQPWREIGHCRFHRDFEVAADPVFDLVVENTSGSSLLLLKAGIRILQRKPGTGGMMGYAQPIKVQAEYSVHCYEEWKRFNLNDKEVWKSFEDPMLMKKDDSPFRFTLCLENFCDTDNASCSEIRFCLQTSSGTVESESIWLEQ